ncbi:MAG: four helix bundle protein [Patescibacteria group bacterium]
MKFERFEDIIAWQKSKELVISAYACFKECIDYSFRNQIQRAVISIMNNIAEGFERKTNKEFIRFLYMAKGSCGEARSMLYLALELKYISREDFEKNYNMALEISKILSGLIKSL